MQGSEDHQGQQRHDDQEYIECLGHIGTVSVKRHKDNKTFPLRQVPERAVFVLFDSWETGFLPLFFALFSRPMTALPSHLPAFSFFGGSLFPSGGLSRSVAVSSSSRQQTFFFFGGSLFLSAVFLVPQRFSSVFFRVRGGAAFRPPLFRGLKYCKRPDKKGGRRCMRKPPVKFPWRPESVRVAVVPADPPKSDRSRKCALSTAVTGRRTVKTSCLRESAASGRTGV